MPKSVSLYSLSTQFVPLEDNKRGKTNVVKREDKDKLFGEEYEPFDFDKSNN